MAAANAERVGKPLLVIEWPKAAETGTLFECYRPPLAE
jgi:hypothetical protein